MIPVQGMQGRSAFVLGMGRSGLIAAQALVAGGAHVLCWDDGEAGLARADEAGLTCANPLRGGLEGVDVMIISPGIPHLYPAPHPAVAEALRLGVPLDNDIGLFFRSFATEDWNSFDLAPKVVAVTGSNGKSTTSALIHHLLAL